MDDKSQYPADSLTDDSLAFFGAITASVSHELNNVMAIMDQTTGLLEDKLAGAQEEIRISPEKLEKIVVSLQKQAARGLEIIKRLNRFAHSADLPAQKFDINEALGNLVRLIDRLAVLKGVSLESGLSENPREIESNPFYLQQAVFTAFRIVLADAQKGDTIRIGCESDDGGTQVMIDGPMHNPDHMNVDRSGLVRILDRLGGRSEIRPSADRLIIRLTLPG